jgi:hypothetical protein
MRYLFGSEHFFRKHHRGQAKPQKMHFSDRLASREYLSLDYIHYFKRVTTGLHPWKFAVQISHTVTIHGIHHVFFKNLYPTCFSDLFPCFLVEICSRIVSTQSFVPKMLLPGSSDLFGIEEGFAKTALIVVVVETVPLRLPLGTPLLGAVDHRGSPLWYIYGVDDAVEICNLQNEQYEISIHTSNRHKYENKQAKVDPF